MPGVTRQLIELQEIDLDVESKDQTVKSISARLGESQALLDARSRLAAEQQRLNELTRDQHGVETEADDLTRKIVSAEEELYSGRIRVPKELSALQQDITASKARRAQLEDKELDIMEQADASRQMVARLAAELEATEAEWRSEQERLGAELEQTTAALSNLKKRQHEVADGIDAQSLGLYRALRKQKGAAIARVEQGICRGCRISLPVSELQRVRSGGLVQCSSCGRILYLP